jgi:ABC-type uncharacterized transport system ATPase subunit
VLVVSEELDELFEISDRLHVIAKGQLSPSRGPWQRPPYRMIGEWMSVERSALWEATDQKEAGPCC